VHASSSTHTQPALAANLERLERLTAWHCDQATTAALLRGGANLTDLRVTACFELPSGAFPVLKQLIRLELRSLDSAFSIAELQHKLPVVEFVSLTAKPLRDLHVLASLPTVQWLQLRSRSAVVEEALSFALPALSFLKVSSDRCLLPSIKLIAMPRLSSFVCYCDDDIDLRTLSFLSNLRSLRLCSTYSTIRLGNLHQSCPQLKAVELSGLVLVDSEWHQPAVKALFIHNFFGSQLCKLFPAVESIEFSDSGGSDDMAHELQHLCDLSTSSFPLPQLRSIALPLDKRIEYSLALNLLGKLRPEVKQITSVQSSWSHQLPQREVFSLS